MKMGNLTIETFVEDSKPLSSKLARLRLEPDANSIFGTVAHGHLGSALHGTVQPTTSL